MPSRLLLNAQATFQDELMSVNIISSSLYDLKTKKTQTYMLPDDVDSLDLKDVEWVFLSVDGVLRSGKRTEVIQKVCSSYSEDKYAFIGPAETNITSRVAVVSPDFLEEAQLSEIPLERVVLYPAVLFDYLSSHGKLDSQDLVTLVVDKYDQEGLTSLHFTIFKGKKILGSRLIPISSLERVKKESLNLLKSLKVDPMLAQVQIVSHDQAVLDLLKSEDTLPKSREVLLSSPVLGFPDTWIKRSSFRPIQSYQKELLFVLSRQKFLAALAVVLPFALYGGLKYSVNFLKQKYHTQYLHLIEEQDRLNKDLKRLEKNRLKSHLVQKDLKNLENFEKSLYSVVPGFDLVSSTVFEVDGRFYYSLTYAHRSVPPTLDKSEEFVVKYLKKAGFLKKNFTSRLKISNKGEGYVEVIGEL